MRRNEHASAGFGDEAALPRVPLPGLTDSCGRFLDWCAPLLTPAELAATGAAVEAFLVPDGPGRRLHAALAEYDAAAGVHSWLDDFWPARYLGRRDRIALNANFFFLFRESGQPQLERAAGLIAAAVHHKLQIDSGCIAPAVQRGQPQSMEQYKFLFATTRIPGAVQDTVRAPYSVQHPGPSRARHILVFCRGAMYRMDVLSPDGRPYPAEDLAAGLRAVRQAAARAAPGTSAGHLTTKARAQWAASRHALAVCHPRNGDVLGQIETALFCLCLEDFAPRDTLEACDQLLHGDGGNRWFDKSLSLIVFEDGTAGINVEHCVLDGTTVLSLVDALPGAPPQAQSPHSGARPAIRALEFVLDDGLRADVQAAAASFAAAGAGAASVIMSFDDFGADRAKQLGFSPDAFAQMAYQLAHKRARGLVGATYEAIATRQYQHGRTEAMRVVTPEIMRFTAVMDDPRADPATRAAAFRAAAEKHVRRAQECQAGRAPEQHLWQLQLIQRRRGRELGVTEPPELYQTPGWLTMRDDYLSTSSAPSASIQYFGFGATGSRCIGIGYVLLSGQLNIYLSAPPSAADQLPVFAARLREAVGELRDLVSADRRSR